jgi:aryl-alcohol dehydrogenase-like predicted oxidoreductase
MMDRRTFVTAVGGTAAMMALPGLAASPTMQRRPIPSSNETVPVIGLGTWQSFDVGNDRASREPLQEVLRSLVGAGGSVVDTSPMYGSSETVLGDLAAEAGLRDSLFLASKVWTRGRQAGIAQMESTLAKLRIETIDLMQIHNLVDWQTQLPTLREWKDQGRVRYIGITHYQSSAYDDLARVIRSHPVDFLQVNYSLAETTSAQRLLPLAAEHGVAVVVNRPFAGGQLFPRVRDKALPAWAADFDCGSWAQFFLKFVLAQPAVTCVIPGTRRPRYMRDNARAGSGRLPDPATQKRMLELLQSF